MPTDRKYPNRPDWRSLPRSSGGGRKPKYPSGAMVPLSARVPQAVKDALIEKYGGVQAAIDELIIKVFNDGAQ